MTVLVIVGLFLGFFVFYQFAFTIISILVSMRVKKQQDDVKSTKFAVLIPAHNEELLIGNLVRSIQRSDYPKSNFEIFVIADNCTDRTADISESLGATCLVRFDEKDRGKPFALNWALTKIRVSDFDAVTIIDADTEIHPQYLTKMNNALFRGDEAIQGYFGVLNPDENWLTRLSVLPAALRYKLQCPGKEALGLSCPLAGNGMVFSTAIIEQFGWNAFSIAENWEYYVILTLAGYTVRHETDAVIYSQVAGNLRDGKAQRMRWLRGRIDTVSRYWKRLIAQTIRKRSLVHLDALIELVRPSHSVLFLACLVYLIFCLIGWKFFSVSVEMFVFSVTLVLMLISIFVCGLIIEKAPLRTWLSLGMVPFYLIWKMFVTLTGLFSLGDREWIRTKRH